MIWLLLISIPTAWAVMLVLGILHGQGYENIPDLSFFVCFVGIFGVAAILRLLGKASRR